MGTNLLISSVSFSWLICLAERDLLVVWAAKVDVCQKTKLEKILRSDVGSVWAL
jgi:hypothetical protein